MEIARCSDAERKTSESQDHRMKKQQQYLLTVIFRFLAKLCKLQAIRSKLRRRCSNHWWPTKKWLNTRKFVWSSTCLAHTKIAPLMASILLRSWKLTLFATVHTLASTASIAIQRCEEWTQTTFLCHMTTRCVPRKWSTDSKNWSSERESSLRNLYLTEKSRGEELLKLQNSKPKNKTIKTRIERINFKLCVNKSLSLN